MPENTGEKNIKIFISYAREDYETAKRLYDDLKASGAEPWMDKVDLLPGQRWKPAISSAIKDCQYFLLILSSASVGKQGFFHKEMRIALEVLESLPQSEIFLIPARTDECRPPHEMLEELQWVDLFPSYETGLKDILRVVKSGQKPVAAVPEDKKSPQIQKSEIKREKPGIADSAESVAEREILEVKESKAGIIGNGAKVEGGIHIHNYGTVRKRENTGNKAAWKILAGFVVLIAVAYLLVSYVDWKRFFSTGETPVTEHKPFTNSIGMKFVYIKPGTFMMGSPKEEPGHQNDEAQHEVTLTKGFYMQTTEVTVGQWRAFAKAANYKSEAETGGGAYVWNGKAWGVKEGTYWDNPGFSQTENYPVTCVSWNDVQKFAAWLKQKEGKEYRLPTEAEWEYSARAGTDTPFAFGKCLSTDQANYNGNYPPEGCAKGTYREKPVSVGSLKANVWGLYDMHGNVWEWCQDWYGGYPAGSVTNPEGSGTGSNRVKRGGSWSNNAVLCRSAYRGRLRPGSRYYSLGFRLVLSPGQQ